MQTRRSSQLGDDESMPQHFAYRTEFAHANHAALTL